MKHTLLESAEQLLSFFSIPIQDENGNVVERKYNHHPFCNYPRETMDWCNCGMTQLRVAVEHERAMANKPKRKIMPNVVFGCFDGETVFLQKVKGKQVYVASNRAFSVKAKFQEDGTLVSVSKNESNNNIILSPPSVEQALHEFDAQSTKREHRYVRGN